MEPVSPKPATGGMTSSVNAAWLIREYQAGIWRYLRSLGCEATLADDLTQDTFIAVLEHSFQELSPAATNAYLRKIAFNRYISHLRSAGKTVYMQDLEIIDRTWQELATHDQGDCLLQALRECLSQLTPRARLALDLRYKEELSREEIATQLEITPDGTKNLLQRAKQQLKTCVQTKTQSN
jgi:RNA polymerase sigma-70 factor, ECF subfamily